MKKHALIISMIVFVSSMQAQYFQHVYHSTPKNENEWFNHGLRDTLISDSILNPNALCYATTGLFKDIGSTGQPTVDRVRFVTTTKWGTPITNVYYKVQNSSQTTEYHAYGNFMEKTPDGYMIVGKVTSFTASNSINGLSDILVMRVNNTGGVTYVKRIDMGYAEEGMCIQQLNGSTDYIICGTRVRSTGSEAIVCRFTQAGAIVWCNAYNFNTSYTNYYARAHHLVIDENDNAYMVGSFRLNSSGQADLLVFGVDANGNLLEHGIVGDSEHDEIGNSIRRTQTQGDFVIVGEVRETGKKRSDGLVFNFTPATATVNNYKYLRSQATPTTYASVILEDVQERIHPVSGVQTYYTTGVVDNAALGKNDVIVYGLNTTLDPNWEYHYGNTENDFAKAIDLINYGTGGDGFVLFGGYGNTNPAVTYSYMVKAYFNGVTSCNDSLQDTLKRDVDPEYVDLDSVIIEIDTLINLYASEFSSMDSVLCEDSVIDLGNSRIRFTNVYQSVLAWPNPTVYGTPVYIEFDMPADEDIRWEVLDLFGRICYSQPIKLREGNNIISTGVFDTLTEGCYTLRIFTSNGVYTSRIIRQ